MIETKLSIDAYGLECDLCKATNTRSAVILENGTFVGIHCETCADQIKATFAPTYEAPAVVLDTTIADLAAMIMAQQKEINALKHMLLSVTDTVDELHDAKDQDLQDLKKSVNARFGMMAGLKN